MASGWKMSQEMKDHLSKKKRERDENNLVRDIYHFDLTKPEVAYFWGIAQTDGHLEGNKNPMSNKGRFQIEISKKDSDLIYKIKSMFDNKVHVGIRERVRNTNFKSGSESISLTISNHGFREGMKLLGFPVGKKNLLINPPIDNFLEVDYIRGLLDGDGSIGFTSEGKPFVSLVTTSESIKEYYIDFISNNIGIIKNNYRNKRDNAFNIVLYNESAVDLSKIIYYDGATSMDRKMNIAKEIKKWERPQTSKRWSDIKRERYDVRSELKQISDILGEC